MKRRAICLVCGLADGNSMGVGVHSFALVRSAGGTSRSFGSIAEQVVAA